MALDREDLNGSKNKDVKGDGDYEETEGIAGEEEEEEEETGGDKDEDKKKKEKKKKEKFYPESHVKEIIRERDKAKRRRREVEAALEKVKQDLAVIEDLKAELQELREFKEEAEKKAEEEKLKDMSEIEKIKATSEREIQRLQKEIEKLQNEATTQVNSIKTELEKKEGLIKSLRASQLESEIAKAASKYNPYNMEQVINIVKPKFEYDEETGKWAVIERDDFGDIVETKTIKDFIDEFLTNPANENLIRVDISPEDKTTPGVNYDLKKKKKGKVVITDKIRREAELKGYTTEKQIREYAETQAKIEKIKAEKKKAFENK